MYALISPFFKTFDDIGLTYFVPDFLRGNIKIGQIVEIPFKGNINLGIILKINNFPNIDFDESKIKSIISIYNDFIFLSGYRVELIQWVSKHYFSSIHNSNSIFFPKNLIEKISKKKLNISKNKEYIYNFNHKIILSQEQQKAYKLISDSKNNKILFYGLTGSGKTEIYIKLIQEYLKNNKQVLFLIPEIILGNQISEKIINVFGNQVIIINSTVTQANRTKYWLDINSGNAKLIIGTRSSIFYPYNNLGLIIIDEEHDNSYISDSSPRYNTIEVANKITNLNNNKLIIASGTPSIKTMYDGVNGKYEIVNLLEKYNKNA